MEPIQGRTKPYPPKPGYGEGVCARCGRSFVNHHNRHRDCRDCRLVTGYYQRAKRRGRDDR